MLSTSISEKRGVVRITESTPVSVNHTSRVSMMEGDIMLKNQVTLLLNENKDLKANLDRVSVKFDDVLKELQVCQQHYQDACQKLEQQTELITRLMTDNTSLIVQIESLWSARSISPDSAPEQNLRYQEQAIQGLMAHVHSIREEFKLLATNILSPSTHTSGLLQDLERLTFKNADLCNALAATQYSRNILEREIIVLKRTLLEERSKVMANKPDIEVKNEGLKKLFDQQVETEQHLADKTEQLRSSKNDVMQLNLQIEKLRENQLTEIDQRCKEVDTLKQQLSDQLNSLQLDRDSLSHTLADKTAENTSLLKKVSTLKKKNSTLESKLCEETIKFRHEMESFDSQMRNILSHAEQLELENTALQSKLTRVQRHLEDDVQQAKSANLEMKDKLRGVTAVMENSLFELESVRSSRVASNQQLAELRAEVEMLQGQLSSCSDLNSEMKSLMEQRTSRIQQLERDLHQQNDNLPTDFFSVSADTLVDMSSSVSSSVSPVHKDHNYLPRYSSAQTNVLNLKQRLADSRHISVRLEVQLAQLKTDNAKLSGSYQAMLSIRDHLGEENATFRNNIRALQSDKETWFKEREKLLTEVSGMSNNILRLTSELTALKNELDHVSELCKRRHDQLQEYSDQIQSAGKLKGDLDKLSAQTTAQHSEIDNLRKIVDTEAHKFETVVCDCENIMLDQQQEMAGLIENTRICGTVNSTRQKQLVMCDENVLRLQGEVEGLRAHKAVLLCMTEQDYAVSNSSCSNISEVVRLKTKLKLQRKQSNFLRVKLGYTLSELRLYKQLKDACDQQLSKLQGCLLEVQGQYQLCATQLEAAEHQLTTRYTG